MTTYVCANCRSTMVRWSARCFKCSAWMKPASVSAVDEGPDLTSRVAATRPAPAPAPAHDREPEYQRVDYGAPGSSPVPITRVDASAKVMRIPTGIEALDYVLGGEENERGLARGSVVLLSGDPGVGKSTLLIQIMAWLRVESRLYVTNEESIEQVAMRAQRVGALSDDLMIVRESNVHHIMTHAETTNAEIVVVDSISTIEAPEIDSRPGGVVQVTACSKLLEAFCRDTRKSLIMICHVNKGGDTAGPNALQHLVDTTLEFTKDPEAGQIRILQANKNRNGATGRSGMFEMTAGGLVGYPILESAEHEERRRIRLEPDDALVPVAQELLDRFLELGGKIDAGLADRIAGRLRTSPCD